MKFPLFGNRFEQPSAARAGGKGGAAEQTADWQK